MRRLDAIWLAGLRSRADVACAAASRGDIFVGADDVRLVVFGSGRRFFGDVREPSTAGGVPVFASINSTRKDEKGYAQAFGVVMLEALHVLRPLQLGSPDRRAGHVACASTAE